MYDFRANIAILLNITPDHLDRYDNDFQNYVDAKMRIIQNQTQNDSFIYWNDDPVIKRELDKYDIKAVQTLSRLNRACPKKYDTFVLDFFNDPNDIIQFDAGFENRKTGTGFRYQAQGAFRAHKGTHRKSIVHVTDAEKAQLFSLVEETARKVLADLLKEAADDKPGDSEE